MQVKYLVSLDDDDVAEKKPFYLAGIKYMPEQPIHGGDEGERLLLYSGDGRKLGHLDVTDNSVNIDGSEYLADIGNFAHYNRKSDSYTCGKCGHEFNAPFFPKECPRCGIGIERVFWR